MAKPNEKKLAISMRKKGISYNEIRDRLKVSKGSLSLWLRDIPIPKSAVGRRKKRIKEGRKKSALSCSMTRRKRRKDLMQRVREEVSSVELTDNAFALVGTALYWAEGQKHGDLSFANSDSSMVVLYVRWLRLILFVPESDITARLNVYLTSGLTYEDVQRYWEETLGLNSEQFRKPTINAVPKTSKAKNIGKHPYGIISIRVRNPQRYRALYTALVEKLGKTTDFVEWGSGCNPSVTYNHVPV